ncbi:MAG TPA: hypothetical protein VGL91_02710 [Acidobacteriota bacterium]|jgi:hypothetical protein
MAVKIEFPRFGNPEAERRIRKSIDEAFKNLPDDWSATLGSNYHDSDWRIVVNGPQQFHWELTLESGDHSAESVVTAIRHVIVGEMSG